MDESRNNPLTALFAAGEGWHNNHHRYQRAARNGFYWWEFDLTWWVIRSMAAVGLIWDIQRVPERIYAEAKAGKAQRAARTMPSIVDAVRCRSSSRKNPTSDRPRVTLASAA